MSHNELEEFDCDECEDTGETWIDVDDTQTCTCRLSLDGDEDTSDYRDGGVK